MRRHRLVQLHQDLERFLATGSRLEPTYFLALMAEGYGKVDQPEEGTRTLAAAKAVVDTTGERWCEAELYRLKGELSLQSGVRGPESAMPNPQLSPTNPPVRSRDVFFHSH